MVGEERYDWSTCGIPEAITDKSIEQQQEREREKRKKLKEKKKKEKEEEKARTESLQRQELAKREEMLMRAGTCDQCNKSMHGILKYDIFDKSCCSSECVVLLRRKLQATAAENRFNLQKK